MLTLVRVLSEMHYDAVRLRAENRAKSTLAFRFLSRVSHLLALFVGLLAAPKRESVKEGTPVVASTSLVGPAIIPTTCGGRRVPALSWGVQSVSRIDAIHRKGERERRALTDGALHR